MRKVFLHIFSGTGGLSQALAAHGIAVVNVDTAIHPSLDILDDRIFRLLGAGFPPARSPACGSAHPATASAGRGEENHDLMGAVCRHNFAAPSFQMGSRTWSVRVMCRPCDLAMLLRRARGTF